MFCLNCNASFALCAPYARPCMQLGTSLHHLARFARLGALGKPKKPKFRFSLRLCKFTELISTAVSPGNEIFIFSKYNFTSQHKVSECQKICGDTVYIDKVVSCQFLSDLRSSNIKNVCKKKQNKTKQ